ncbi:MAG: mechanosensitive ion channel family protein [Acidobacteria bacterium]|jgi:small conductance mechanosensitive channel|nr:mechanosensitive ion channel family protein [Acidobacteriota bacterium]
MKELITAWGKGILPWLYVHGTRIAVILILAFVLNKAVRKFIEKAVRLAVVADGVSSAEAEKKREDTLIHIFNAVARITLLILAGLMVLQELGLMIGPILAGAGIIGLAFGFGGQYLIRDLIAGFFIILENQYRIGDVVAFDGVDGMVEEIGLRTTTLRDLDGTVHHVPHGEIKRVSNLSKNFSRVNLDVGVAYDSDIGRVRAVVDRVGAELAADPRWREAITRPPQFLRVQRLGESAVIIKVLGETMPLKQWEVAGELRQRLLAAFRSEGIDIPFPQRVVHQGK